VSRAGAVKLRYLDQFETVYVYGDTPEDSASSWTYNPRNRLAQTVSDQFPVGSFSDESTTATWIVVGTGSSRRPICSRRAVKIDSSG
jgi:hypothetical protein